MSAESTTAASVAADQVAVIRGAFEKGDGEVARVIAPLVKSGAASAAASVEAGAEQLGAATRGAFEREVLPAATKQALQVF